jgi:alkaline phosphatase
MSVNPNSLLNASVDGLGNVVTLYFSDKLDTSSVPALDQFAVFSDGIEQVITAIQLVNNQVILTLAASLDSLLPVTVSYTSSSDTLQNINGDDVASFEDAEVDNQLSLTASESESFTFASTITMDYGAEISAFDPSSQRLFVTSPEDGLQILGIDDQLQMTKFATIELGSKMVNSVAVKNGIVAVAVADADKTQPGKVYFLDAGATILDASMILGSVEVGANPDMLTFTPDGSKVLVANEGEMASESSDPEGSVSIIDLSEVLAGKATEPTVTTAGFTAFNSQLDALKEAGVRLFAGEDGFESTTVAQDLEPEYISISPDGTTAFVTLQENNAIAILDIASGTFTGIVPLGLKSFSSLPFDGSDKDGIDLQTGQPVYGQYMPDAIASFTGSDGETYYVIANEGDDRDDFLATPETARVKDLVLDSTVFPDAATLQGNNELGRLTVSNASGNNGDTDGDGDIDQLLAYGARSFSILDSEGNIVFDSASHIEQFVAQYGLYTGAAGAGLFDDGRSDNKGPEPEGITVGVVDGKTLAFVTLERGGGGVMVYDVTNPEEVSFVQYLAHSGDVSPEGVLFISAADSPTGHELLIVSNEVSNTVTIFQENHAPELVDGYSDVTVMEDQAFDRVLVVENMFSDADEDDTLTYTVTLANGDPLPTWLTVSETEQNLDEMLDYFKSGGQWPATDSASAGTAIATGVKTVDGNIAWERTDSAGGEIETIAETLRGELGYAIGVASTVPFSHATPATFVSHDLSRNNYWDIAHEILFETQPEVVIGGGMENSNFAKAVKSAGNVDRDLDDNGYNDDYDAFVNDTDGTEYVFVKREEGEDGGDTLAAAAATVDLSAGEKLFGLYGTSGGNFEYYNVYDTPGIATITRSTTDATPTVDEDPTLAEVTNVSLSVLNQDADGFFIMIEQGDIDWSNHANDYENMIGGVYDLEMAVTAAEKYVASGVNGIDWSNTLVIVTSDHSNSYMRNESVLGIGDLGEVGTDVTYASSGHTHELVTVSARGAGATYFGELAGQIYDGTEIIDNTQIYEAMMNAATEAGAEHIILFIGDGMNVEHEIAGSRYLYGEDFGLTWHDWGTLEDGWSGYASTWDVTAYNKYASMAGVDSYSETTFDPLIGYDPAKGGVTPYPVEMPESFTLSGTPGHEDVGSIEIKVTATDKSGVSVSDTFTLTVVDDVAPTVTASNPADEAAAVDVNGTITFEFSEEIELLDETGVVLHAGSVDGAVVDADVSVTGSTLMVDPTGALVNGTEYYLTFDGDAVCDLAGNYYDDDESDVFHFTTLDAAVAATGGSSDGLGAGEMLAGVAGLGLLAFLIL